MTETVLVKKNINNPLVTIIIQTYNRKNLLKCALESARKQTYKNIEILIGDNHSKDGTEYYCREQEEEDSRIKYFRHKKNIGMVGNANFLLNNVTGKYFIWLNDDDWLDLNYVEECIKYINDKSDYSMVCPSTILHKKEYIDDRNYSSEKCKIVKLNSNNITERLENYLLNQDDIQMSSGCFRTSVAKQIKSAEKTYLTNRYNEDIIFEIKFLTAGKCKMLSKTHLHKRDNGYSRKVETAHKVYSIKGLKSRNLIKERCKIFSNAILTDEFFTTILDNKNKKSVAKKIKRTFKPLIIYGNIRIFYEDIKNLCRNIRNTTVLGINYFRLFKI